MRGAVSPLSFFGVHFLTLLDVFKHWELYHIKGTVHPTKSKILLSFLFTCSDIHPHGLFFCDLPSYQIPAREMSAFCVA